MEEDPLPSITQEMMKVLGVLCQELEMKTKYVHLIIIMALH